MEKLLNTHCKTCEYRSYSKDRPLRTVSEKVSYVGYCPRLGTKEECITLIDTLRSIKFNCLDYIPEYWFYWGVKEDRNWKWVAINDTNNKNKKYVGEPHYLCSHITRNNAEYRYTNWSSCKVKV